LPEEIPLYAGDMDADLKLVSRNSEAERITADLSLTQKMPCPSWGGSFPTRRMPLAPRPEKGKGDSVVFA